MKTAVVDRRALVRAVFLDLNGTLVEPVLVESLDHLCVIPGAFLALARLESHGIFCPIVTIQSRIAKGVFSEDDFKAWFASFDADVRRAGGRLHGLYLCPHSFDEVCECKKPKPYLFERAASDLNLDIHEAVVIGDTGADIEAAERLGIDSCLVLTGWGLANRGTHGARASHVATDISTAVEWLLSER